ncbi:Hypothetical_protein [Hexamita inflata]|uniref:Hypothetical_protein n=1 Tax=Hexamita inflata TaxID=28002 RepID=A0AA86PUW3_9EUKA|nr:Hypothetical protein HINF_LOCUS34324 [Hexamita inflata]
MSVFISTAPKLTQKNASPIYKLEYSKTSLQKFQLQPNKSQVKSVIANFKPQTNEITKTNIKNNSLAKYSFNLPELDNKISNDGFKQVKQTYPQTTQELEQIPYITPYQQIRRRSETGKKCNTLEYILEQEQIKMNIIRNQQRSRLYSSELSDEHSSMSTRSLQSRLKVYERNQLDKYEEISISVEDIQIIEDYEMQSQ